MATDAPVNDIVKALDAGYTNSELFTSLNVGTTAELNSALKQVSGSRATTVFPRSARVKQPLWYAGRCRAESG